MSYSRCPKGKTFLVSGVPHFKEVVMMATVCDFCGHNRTNDVKAGGGCVELKGKKISLRVTDPSDMNRDVLKVSCCV